MPKFAFNVILEVNEFEADTPDEAQQLIDNYIDRLAEVVDNKIQWESCDSQLIHVDSPWEKE